MAEIQPFTIIVTPANASVQFEDVQESYSAGMLLAPGDYALVISADGYENWEETLTHSAVPTRSEVTLAPRRFGFAIDLSPPDAKVVFMAAENAGGEILEPEREYRPGMMLAAGWARRPRERQTRS